MELGRRDFCKSLCRLASGLFVPSAFAILHKLETEAEAQPGPGLPYYGAGAAGLSALAQAALGFWNMDETSSGASPVNRVDATGHGWTATESNGNMASAAGVINNGVAVSSSSKSLSVSASIDIRVQTAPFSIVFWYNPTSIASGAAMVSTIASGGTKGFLFYLASNGAVHFYSTDNAGTVTDAGAMTNPTNVSTGSFQHLAFTYDGATTIEGYLNASNHNTATINGLGISKGNAAFTIGNYVGNSAGVPGVIDIVGYFDRKITSAEVSTLFNSNAGRQWGAF